MGLAMVRRVRGNAIFVTIDVGYCYLHCEVH